MKLGHPTEKQIRQAIRMTAAMNLAVLGKMIGRIGGGGSVMVNGASHQFRGYLDVRLSFAVDGCVQNFHFLAIPIGEGRHTGRHYADLDVRGETALAKLIGIATDGVTNILGCNRGFAKLMREACAALGGRGIVTIWCGSHQLNRAVGKFLAGFDDFVDWWSILLFPGAEGFEDARKM
ncbi:hypothetical protein GQ600_7012 [Phytophthora cactorum]|nr:hypothetical protein GQ600_7012 [Phytophthora cactorum]